MKTAAERFWPKVDQREPEECWPWKAAINSNGYGDFYLDVSQRKKINASRFALEQHLGRRLLSDEVACHTCDNRPCCNPAHLFAGSPRDNVQDAVSKGRMHRWAGQRSGSANPKAKLTESDVREIKRALSAGARQSDLARRFGVKFPTIASIKNGRNWGHVE